MNEGRLQMKSISHGVRLGLVSVTAAMLGCAGSEPLLRPIPNYPDYRVEPRPGDDVRHAHIGLANMPDLVPLATRPDGIDAPCRNFWVVVRAANQGSITSRNFTAEVNTRLTSRRNRVSEQLHSVAFSTLDPGKMVEQRVGPVSIPFWIVDDARLRDAQGNPVPEQRLFVLGDAVVEVVVDPPRPPNRTYGVVVEFDESNNQRVDSIGPAWCVIERD